MELKLMIRCPGQLVIDWFHSAANEIQDDQALKPVALFRRLLPPVRCRGIHAGWIRHALFFSRSGVLAIANLVHGGLGFGVEWVLLQDFLKDSSRVFNHVVGDQDIRAQKSPFDEAADASDEGVARSSVKTSRRQAISRCSCASLISPRFGL